MAIAWIKCTTSNTSNEYKKSYSLPITFTTIYSIVGSTMSNSGLNTSSNNPSYASMEIACTNSYEYSTSSITISAMSSKQIKGFAIFGKKS